MDERTNMKTAKRETTNVQEFGVLSAFRVLVGTVVHSKPRQVEAAYIECGNGAAAMQVA